MDSFPTLEALGFPARRSNHRGKWRAIYLEPMVGSGERLCIGVVAADAERAVVAGVEELERLACIYGDAAEAFIFASQIGLRSIEDRVSQEGIDSLTDWSGGLDGLTCGKVQLGAGESLEDIAHTGLMQCASLQLRAQRQRREGDNAVHSLAEQTSRRLEFLIRESAVGQHPGLESSFGKLFRIADNARPTRIGFIGKKIVANFSILVPGRIGSLVDVAKAKLWDLQTLKSDGKVDLFPRGDAVDFELLLHRVSPGDPLYSDRQLANVESAVLELEAEADKAKIRCRPMYSPLEIANFLVRKEAA